MHKKQLTRQIHAQIFVPLIFVPNKKNSKFQVAPPASNLPPRQQFPVASPPHGGRSITPWAGPRARGDTRRSTGGACGPPPRPSAGSSSCSAPSSPSLLLPPRRPPPSSAAASPPCPPPRAPPVPSGPPTWWRRRRCTRRTRRPSSAGSRRRSTAPGTRARQVSRGRPSVSVSGSAGCACLILSARVRRMGFGRWCRWRVRARCL